jgi:hypothetical protein
MDLIESIEKREKQLLATINVDIGRWQEVKELLKVLKDEAAKLAKDISSGNGGDPQPSDVGK